MCFCTYKNLAILQIEMYFSELKIQKNEKKRKTFIDKELKLTERFEFRCTENGNKENTTN
jgi:hypothetical protein